jgi:hypothetical protein
MRFIMVNGRTPRSRSLCAMCDQPARVNYLREIGTRLIYCDHNCYESHCKSVVLLLENRAMASLSHPAFGYRSTPSGERSLR